MPPSARDRVAPLNYLQPMQERLHTYAYDPPGGGPRCNGRLVAHTSLIRDARAAPVPATLEAEGFTRLDHASAVRDFHEEDTVRGRYYDEAQALIVALTGARRARVFDHTLRQRAPGRPPLDGLGGSFAAVREPVGRVHADYTPVSAPQRLQAVLAAMGATAPLPRRYLILGLWRPLHDEPLQDAPLALADARSVARADLVPNDLVYPDRRGQTFAVLQRDTHRWHYYPGMRRDELLVFVHYDSRTEGDGLQRAAPHTAFEDPATPADAPPRRSIELRALALFDD